MTAFEIEGPGQLLGSGIREGQRLQPDLIQDPLPALRIELSSKAKT